MGSKVFVHIAREERAGEGAVSERERRESAFDLLTQEMQFCRFTST